MTLRDLPIIILKPHERRVRPIWAVLYWLGWLAAAATSPLWWPG